MGRAFYIESVEEAAALAGGYARLADELGVSTEEVERWSAGAAIPECAVFLRLIDLVTAASDPRGRSATAAPEAESPASAAANRQPLEA
jgi:hypothetical protein